LSVRGGGGEKEDELREEREGRWMAEET